MRRLVEDTSAGQQNVKEARAKLTAKISMLKPYTLQCMH
jgi:hypothetical protein